MLVEDQNYLYILNFPHKLTVIQLSYFRADCPYCFPLSGVNVWSTSCNWLWQVTHRLTGHIMGCTLWGAAVCAFLRSTMSQKSPLGLRRCCDSWNFAPGHRLTILTVVGHLHLALLGPEHSLGHLADGLFVGQATVEEVTGAWLLHDVRSWETCHLAEAIVAVYDCTVLHPGIGYHKFPVCIKRKSINCVLPATSEFNQCLKAFSLRLYRIRFCSVNLTSVVF